MSANWLKIGNTVINPDRIVAIVLDQEWETVEDLQDVNLEPAASGKETHRGVEVVLDISQSHLPADELFPKASDATKKGLSKDWASDGASLLTLRFPDGSDEAQAVWDFVGRATAGETTTRKII
jgi:hypothetical protein